MLQTESIANIILPKVDQASMLGTAKRRIMIVDDNSFFSRCLAALIDHEQDLMVCDIANSYLQVVKHLVESRPQLLLMDVCIGAENGIEIAKKLRSMKVDVPIILTSSIAEPSVVELQEIGQCGFISKFQKPADFLKRIRAFVP